MDYLNTTREGPNLTIRPDTLAVVDQSSRVCGIANLIVADSSFFPTCLRCNIHFPVVAVTEKIAAMLS